MTEQDQNNNEDVVSSPVIGGHRRETERRRRHRFTRILSLAGILLLITALVIPATGYFVVFVQPHRETALVINDERYTWGDYLARLKMIVAEAQAIGTWAPESLNNLIFDMVNDLERREIVKQYAPLENVAVSEQEIDNEMKARIVGVSNVDNPDIPESEYRERLRLRLEILQVSEEFFREIAREQALQNKLEAVLQESIPAKLEQRHLYEIRFNSSETDLLDARAALDRFDAGESFQDLARELSDDNAVAEQGGDLGWVPRGIKDEYNDVMVELGDGEVSGPVVTSTGVSIFLAEGVLELRDVREDHIKPLQDQALRAWTAAHRADLVAANALSRPGGGLSSNRYQWVLEQLKQDRELFPTRSASE